MLVLKNISKKFDNRMILNDISFQFPDTGFIGIQGESGCGKSTLLYVIGMLDSAFDGDVLYNGEKIVQAKSFIRSHISFMMQNKDIISSMTIKENILLAAQVSYKQYHYSQLKKITKQLGIFDLLDKFPSQLSGGELKRVSIAKALMKQSSLILCDEPTGALHESQAHEVMKILKHTSHDRLVIIVSHDPQLLSLYCDSVLTLKDGKLKGKIMKRDNIVKENHNHAFHSLIRYSLRQLFFQKKKLVFLFLFQWILISIFFLMTTAMNGIDDAISQDEKQSVTRYMCVMENKDRNIFYDIPKIENADIQYSYHLDQLHIFSKQKEMNSSLSFLPRNTSHIQLQHGRMPSQYNEVIISESLYHSLNNRSLRIRYEDFQMELKVVGVLDPSLLKGEEIYCSQLLKDKIPFLKDEYSLILESFNMKELYQSLSRNYIVYSEVLERVESYQSLLFLAKVVANIFIGVSLFVSLLLIGIVESILYYERKHDVAYLLSLGIEPRRLVFLSLLESMTLGMIIAVIGCFISSLLYYFFNNVYHLQLHFYFHLQLKKILFHSYDLYIFIIFIYMFMVILGSLFPMKRMMKVDMINVLREE